MCEPREEEAVRRLTRPARDSAELMHERSCSARRGDGARRIGVEKPHVDWSPSVTAGPAAGRPPSPPSPVERRDDGGRAAVLPTAGTRWPDRAPKQKRIVGRLAPDGASVTPDVDDGRLRPGARSSSITVLQRPLACSSNETREATLPHRRSPSLDADPMVLPSSAHKARPSLRVLRQMASDALPRRLPRHVSAVDLPRR